MNSGFATDNVHEGGFVVIETGDVNDSDNAKLYIKGTTRYEFITDLSGAQGIQGPQGIQGIQDIQGVQGEVGAKGDKGDRGPSGVYVGSGNMPDDCNVQIDPTGDAITIDSLVSLVIAALPVYGGETE
jgi:hypothetical protein